MSNKNIATTNAIIPTITPGAPPSSIITSSTTQYTIPPTTTAIIADTSVLIIHVTAVPPTLAIARLDGISDVHGAIPIVNKMKSPIIIIPKKG